MIAVHFNKEEKCDIMLRWWQNFSITTIWNLSNDGRRRPQQERCTHHAFFVWHLLAVVTGLWMELRNFTPPPYGVSEHKINFLFLNLDAFLSDSTWENFPDILQIK